MLEISSETNNSINEIKNDSGPINLKENFIKKLSLKNLPIQTEKSEIIKDQNENEESELEDEETKKKRLKKERVEFLIKLLTESPKRKKNKFGVGFKLKPLNQSKFSIDNKSTSTRRSKTEYSVDYNKPMPKYLTLKEQRRWISRMKKEKERKKKAKEKKENKEILKEIKSFRNTKTNREIFRSNLNRLYGYSHKFLFYNAKLKKEKWDNLEKYQEDILRVSSMNLSKDNMLKLFSDLKSIRIKSEQAKPLPPINFKALVHHSLDEDINRKKRFGFRMPKKKFSEMDEYEKEMYLIKTSRRHEKLNIGNNKFLYKMYEILPEHVVDTVYGKKRKF